MDELDKASRTMLVKSTLDQIRLANIFLNIAANPLSDAEKIGPEPAARGADPRDDQPTLGR